MFPLLLPSNFPPQQNWGKDLTCLSSEMAKSNSTLEQCWPISFYFTQKQNKNFFQKAYILNIVKVTDNVITLSQCESAYNNRTINIANPT
jgi:hypothetical protein